MLQITVPSGELFDERKGEFVTSEERTLQLEHSLVSLSKWESKWKKPFMSRQEMTYEETVDYIRCMTITQNVNPNTYLFLTNDNINRVKEYINDSMTATWFPDDKRRTNNGREVTSELIYCWMITLNIPPDYQKWHLNRLLTLIKVCNAESQPKKRMSTRDIMRQNSSLNAQRRSRLKSKG